jgi:hypothetical protein
MGAKLRAFDPEKPHRQPLFLDLYFSNFSQINGRDMGIKKMGFAPGNRAVFQQQSIKVKSSS